MFPVFHQCTNVIRYAKLLALLCSVLVQYSCHHSVFAAAVVSPKTQVVTPTSTGATNQNKSVITVETVLERLSPDSNVSTVFNESAILRNDWNKEHRIFGLDTGAIKRTFYVVAALTGIVLVYFTFKGISAMRHRRHKPRRYGLLAEGKEMRHFQEEDDDDSDVGDEDATLFDAKKYKPLSKRKQ